MKENKRSNFSDRWGTTRGGGLFSDSFPGQLNLFQLRYTIKFDHLGEILFQSTPVEKR